MTVNDLIAELNNLPAELKACNIICSGEYGDLNLVNGITTININEIENKFDKVFYSGFSGGKNIVLMIE